VLNPRPEGGTTKPDLNVSQRPRICEIEKNRVSINL